MKNRDSILTDRVPLEDSMLFLFVIILSFSTVFFLLKFLSLQKEFQNLRKSMEKIDPTISNQQLRVITQNKESIGLAIEINKLYQSVRDDHAKNVSALREVQQSMENISHDLRTPLTSIVGYLDILSKYDEPSEEKWEYLEICRRKAKTLQSLVQNLFELSRLENHEYPFEMERMNVTGILQEELVAIYDLFSTLPTEPDISLPDTPLWVIGDRRGFSRIFANLLNNMIKHGNGQSMKIIGKQEENQVIFLFENGAPDLSEEDLPKIFIRSFTKDRMRSEENSGFGLSIVKEFTDQMGGNIKAEKIGENLRFTLCWNTTI